MRRGLINEERYPDKMVPNMEHKPIIEMVHAINKSRH